MSGGRVRFVYFSSDFEPGDRARGVRVPLERQAQGALESLGFWGSIHY